MSLLSSNSNHLHFLKLGYKIFYPITNKMSCKSCNIIYLIACNKCYKQYVGQTSRKLKDRLNDYRCNIKIHKNTTIAVHFNNPLHTIFNLSITPIEQINSKSTTELLHREQFWMTILHTKCPHSLNNIHSYKKNLQ